MGQRLLFAPCKHIKDVDYQQDWHCTMGEHSGNISSVAGDVKRLFNILSSQVGSRNNYVFFLKTALSIFIPFVSES